MTHRLRKPLVAVAVVLAMAATLILANASTWVDREFPGFLVLENGVIASAGLTHWPATSNGELFQQTIRAYDGIDFKDATDFHSYIRSLPVGTEVSYELIRGNKVETRLVPTRSMSQSDVMLLFGATFLAAIAFLGVAAALLFIAPKDPASVGSALSFSITGVFALTALDLYGPYHFFRVHAVAECFMGAGTLHMALAFPYRRAIATRHRWLIPSVYACATALGLVTALMAHIPSVYVVTHGMAVAIAGIAFLAMVVSQAAAFIWPRDYESRQRVQILALGTLATVSPGFVVLFVSIVSGGGAAENAIGWAGAFFPISVAYAVLRSDALGVDAIIRRTVTYTTLTLVVGASYAAAIGSVDALASGQEQVPRWVSILLFSAFCTFAVLPLRDRVQAWVDKSFFRSVYDFRVIVESTSATLARLTDLEEIKRIIEVAARESLQPETVELSPIDFDEPSHETSEESGAAAVVEMADGGIAVPFRTSNRTVALLTLGRRLSGRFYSSEDRALLQVLANQGAIAIENAFALQSVRDLNRTLERRVQDRTAELAATVEELTSTQVQLVQAERLAAVGELAAGVAHEVNNPLNFARNSLRTLDVLVDELADVTCQEANVDGKKPDDARSASDTQEIATDIRELVQILGSGLDRTAKLVADLRDFASPRSAEPQRFELLATVRNTLQLTRTTLDELGVELSIEPTATRDGPYVIADEASVVQIILNIVKNAIDAVEECESPSIEIVLSTDEQRRIALLQISDNGTGIPGDISDRVFDPFFTTKEAGKGTGLGLPMCQRIVQENDGKIRIESTPGAGTTVTIELPLAALCVAESENPSAD